MTKSVTTSRQPNPKIWLRTPISYYGGKQQMLQHILPLIPEHKTYIEPFFGGGAVFWAKAPADIEIINDNNGAAINFYKQLKINFSSLKLLIGSTLHSRDSYREAIVIYHTPHLFNDLVRAWSFWVVTNMGFTRKIGSWGYDRSGRQERMITRKKKEFTDAYSNRLENTSIEANDAVKVITSRDADQAFVYCDPPYVGSNLGHYGGYTQEHFNDLLDTLVALKGKFLLSSYPNETLDRYVKEHGWYQKTFKMQLSAGNKGTGRKKIEVLTANYKI